MRFTAGHVYEAGEALTDADKGCALVLKSDQKVYKSTIAKDKKIIGFMSEIIKARLSVNNNEVDNAVHVISVGDSYEWKKESEHAEFEQCVEGVKVCNQNGDIEVGDLLCTSDTPGCFMKQDDDIIRSSTAARAMQDVSFGSESVKDKVYCVMMCG